MLLALWQLQAHAGSLAAVLVSIDALAWPPFPLSLLLMLRLMLLMLLMVLMVLMRWLLEHHQPRCYVILVSPSSAWLHLGLQVAPADMDGKVSDRQVNDAVLHHTRLAPDPGDDPQADNKAQLHPITRSRPQPQERSPHQIINAFVPQQLG